MVLVGAALTISAPASATDAEAMADYIRARIADGEGQPDAAVASYAALLTAQPDDPAMALRAYRGGMAAGDKALALRASRVLAAQGALPAEGRLLLLAEAMNAGDWRSADLIIDRLGDEGNFDFLAPVLRAWAHFGAGKKDALDLLDSRPASGLTAAYASEHRALLMIASGKPDEGIAILRTLPVNSASFSGSALRIAAASMLSKSGRKAEAISILAGADPAVTAARAMLVSGRPLTVRADTASRGAALLVMRLAEDIGGRQAGALSVSLARIATFLDPMSDAAWVVTADLLRNQGNSGAALVAASRVSPKGPWRNQATDLRVALLAGSGQGASALALASLSAKAKDASSSDFTRLGDLLSADKRYGEAAAAYRTAIARAEADGGAAEWSNWLMLGSALKDSGDWDGAKAALQKALTLAPDQPVLLNYLGYSQLERRENLAEAEAMIVRANALSPDDPSFIDSLGWAYHVRGDAKRAIETLERAVDVVPAESIMNEHLGDAYWAAGRKMEARYAWQSALVTADGDAVARLKAKADLGWTAANAAP